MFAGIHVHHVKMFVTASSLSSELSRVGHEVCIAADWLVFFVRETSNSCEGRDETPNYVLTTHIVDIS